VFLHVTDPLHISLPLYSFLQTAGPYAYGSDFTENSARVNLEIPVENARASAAVTDLTVTVVDAEDHVVLTMKTGATIAAGASETLRVSDLLRSQRWWEPDFPHVYRAQCELRTNGQVVDTTQVSFGLRAARWDAHTGLRLNGRPLKLHGWGQKPTDEWPGLGAAQPDWMHFFTLQRMREAGGNFVRWGHCAAGPAMIAAGDRLGIIAEQPGVDGEGDAQGDAWKIRAAAFRDVVIYYRNAPSILIWEGGNQKVIREHAQELRGIMDRYDPHGGRAYAHRRADEVTAEFMDACIGTEGGREIARLPVVEGEYDREESPRRVWDNASPPNFGYPEAKGQTYQLTSEQFAVNEVEQYVQKLGAPDHCGGANWIFSDSTSGGRVSVEVARASGEVDGVRLPKEAYYACQAMFRSDPQVHIVGHWTYPAGTKKTVYVVSNGDAVELFVNGRSLGLGKVSDRFLFTFADVAWEAGEIKAVSLRAGKVTATQTERTAGAPVALRMTAITGPGGLQADGSDVALFDVEAVDAKGERCPTYQHRVDFECSGPAVWRGGYNSGKINSTNHPYLDLEAGVNRVSVRATREAGVITLTARAEGLTPATISVESHAAPIIDGRSGAMPRIPEVALPTARPAPVADELAGWVRRTAIPDTPRFVKAFSYSGPTKGAGVHPDARDARRIYPVVDRFFDNLPDELKGADYVQAPAADANYSAVDLMEISVPRGAVVSVAHDDRLARPSWLTKQFQPSNPFITIDGHRLSIFTHRAEQDESITLGSNTEDAASAPADVFMYVVFVKSG
jgi:beta-galactosidase